MSLGKEAIQGNLSLGGFIRVTRAESSKTGDHPVIYLSSDSINYIGVRGDKVFLSLDRFAVVIEESMSEVSDLMRKANKYK